MIPKPERKRDAHARRGQAGRAEQVQRGGLALRAEVGRCIPFKRAGSLQGEDEVKEHEWRQVDVTMA